MPETHDAPQLDLHIGPVRLFVHSVFVHRQRWPEPLRTGRKAPIVETGGSTYEDEDPWRIGHAVAFRIPLTRIGFVVGYWDVADPTRSESALWEQEGVAQLLVPGINADQVKHWPRPGETPSTEGTAYQDTEGVESWVEEEDSGDPNVVELDDGTEMRITPWG